MKGTNAEVSCFLVQAGPSGVNQEQASPEVSGTSKLSEAFQLIIAFHSHLCAVSTSSWPCAGRFNFPASAARTAAKPTKLHSLAARTVCLCAQAYGRAIAAYQRGLGPDATPAGGASGQIMGEASAQRLADRVRVS